VGVTRHATGIEFELASIRSIDVSVSTISIGAWVIGLLEDSLPGGTPV